MSSDLPHESGATAGLLLPDHEGIAAAAALLAQGELLGLPTETVYGLAADASDPAAVAKIYRTKGRPSNHPMIVHLPPGGDPLWWADHLSPAAQALIDAFWPGPLSLIVKRAAHIPDTVSGGQDSIALRCPSHPVAQAVLDAFSMLRGGHGGVAAPSANRFGKVSPTTAQHVIDEFHGTVSVLDGGDSVVGIESTIVDLSRGFPALLRPGHITPEQIAEVLGEMPVLPGASGQFSGAGAIAVPRASGTLRAHYAPSTPLQVLPLMQILQMLQTFGALQAAGQHERYAVVLRGGSQSKTSDRDQGSAGTESTASITSAISTLSGMANVSVTHAPADPEGFARVLYGMLRALDTQQVSRILVEKLPEDAAWRAVNDRLGRAAAAFMPESPATP